MRVIDNIHKQLIKKVPYGDAIRRQKVDKNDLNADDLYMVVDFFVGDGNVRIVNLASGVVVKVPEDEEVLLVERAYVEVESHNGYI